MGEGQDHELVLLRGAVGRPPFDPRYVSTNPLLGRGGRRPGWVHPLAANRKPTPTAVYTQVTGSG